MDDLIRRCIDMDEWNHSWHNKFKELSDFEKAKEVIEEKMSDRINELKTLQDGIDRINSIIVSESRAEEPRC